MVFRPMVKTTWERDEQKEKAFKAIVFIFVNKIVKVQTDECNGGRDGRRQQAVIGVEHECPDHYHSSGQHYRSEGRTGREHIRV